MARTWLHFRKRGFENDSQQKRAHPLSRKTYLGSFAFNLVAALLPALYITLSKVWVANFDSAHLATTNVYNYLGTIAEALNDGLPRVVWLVVADYSTRTLASRLEMTLVLIGVQALFGLLLTLAFIAAAPSLAQSFVPADVSQSSIAYVRITAPTAFTGMAQTAVSAATRALDQPDVTVVINVSCTLLKIALELLLISKFHVGLITPSIAAQAVIQQACDLLATVVGLAYFALNFRRLHRTLQPGELHVWPPWPALKVLVPPARWTFLESATRNATYLWVVSRVTALGDDYATAWGLFTLTIRWGLIMAPASALYSSSLTFVGHKWGKWRYDRQNADQRYPVATKEDIRAVARPAMISAAGALAVEIVVCILLTAWGIEKFAFFLCQSDSVASIVATLWREIEWCYLFFAVGWQASTVLLATSPPYFLGSSFASNIFWMIPWAVVLAVVQLAPPDMWKLVTIMLGGAVVVDTIAVLAAIFWWSRRLCRGKVHVDPVRADLRPCHREAPNAGDAIPLESLPASSR